MNLKDIGDQARAELAEPIDRQMSPLGLAAMDALAPRPGQTVLDIGCGAGQTIVQLTGRVGTSGRVIGVDIAPRVLAVAHARTRHLPQVTLMREDVTDLTLPDGSIDSVFSRFGMMFFADPGRAFSNLRRMLKPCGRIGFVCWRSMRANELDSFPIAASGMDVIVDATPFSFEDPVLTERLLSSTGFSDIRIDAADLEVSAGGVDETLRVVTRVGALGKVHI